MDDLAGSPYSLNRGTKLGRAENIANKANLITSDISGMNIVNGMLQKMTSAAIVQRFVDVAHGSGRIAKHRLRHFGLSDEMAERVFAQLRDPKNVTTARGALTRNKVQRINMSSWSDKEAAAAFQDATWRMARNVIQKNDIGMLHEWMSHPMGRIITQFRKFIFGSFTNHLLFNANMARRGDMKAMAFFLVSTATAGMVYVAQEKLRSIGRSDADDYLENRLSWDNIAKASFARSSYASIIPMLIDSGPAGIATGSQQFDFRTTGMPSDVLWGNPTASLMDDTQRALRSMIAPWVHGREYSQQEARQIMRVLPFGNALPALAGLNALIAPLPETAPRDQR